MSDDEIAYLIWASENNSIDNEHKTKKLISEYKLFKAEALAAREWADTDNDTGQAVKYIEARAATDRFIKEPK